MTVLSETSATRLIARIDELIADLDEAPAEDAMDLPGMANIRSPNPNGEYAKLSQPQAILKALEYGPQTYKEIFQRLNSGGKAVRSPSYVSSVLARLKDKVRRNGGGKYHLVHHATIGQILANVS